VADNWLRVSYVSEWFSACAHILKEEKWYMDQEPLTDQETDILLQQQQ
jgi:hypothetical protein